MPIDIHLTKYEARFSDDRPCEEICDHTQLELTVPFETNFVAAQERKSSKYASVISGFEETSILLEVGSRDIGAYGTCSTLRKICGSSKKRLEILCIR